MIRATFRTRPTRALCFDLESRPSAFWGSWGPTAEITAFAWKWSDEDHVHTMMLQANERFDVGERRPVSHTKAYTRFRDVLLEADLVYGHNIRRFDLPLFQAGLMRRLLPTLIPLRTSDTLRDYPKRKDMSASLENLAKLYVEDVGDKLHMAIVDWERANRLSPDGIDHARDRVTSDVILQERLRERLIERGHLREARWWNP